MPIKTDGHPKRQIALHLDPAPTKLWIQDVKIETLDPLTAISQEAMSGVFGWKAWLVADKGDAAFHRAQDANYTLLASESAVVSFDDILFVFYLSCRNPGTHIAQEFAVFFVEIADDNSSDRHALS